MNLNVEGVFPYIVDHGRRTTLIFAPLSNGHIGGDEEHIRICPKEEISQDQITLFLAKIVDVS